MIKLWRNRWLIPAGILAGYTGLIGFIGAEHLIELIRGQSSYIPLSFSIFCFLLAQIWGTAAYGLYKQRPWARGFAFGTLVFNTAMMLLLQGPFFDAHLGGHVLGILCLLGDQMAQRYELNPDTIGKEKLTAKGARYMAFSAAMLGLAVPTLVVYGALTFWSTGVPYMGLAALALAGAGVAGFLNSRGWSIFLLAGSGALVAISVLSMMSDGLRAMEITSSVFGGVGGVALGLALLPFALPVYRFLVKGQRTA